jgi:hypothetical protein
MSAFDISHFHRLLDQAVAWVAESLSEVEAELYTRQNFPQIWFQVLQRLDVVRTKTHAAIIQPQSYVCLRYFPLPPSAGPGGCLGCGADRY